MARQTPQQIAEKQIRRATASVGDYKDGVRGVKESPTQKAARKKDKYLANIQEAVHSGRYEDGLNGVSKEDWINATAGKGGDRYAKGVEASRSKLEDFHAQIAPHRDAVKSELDAMPDDTLEQRLAKMEHNARRMSEYTHKPRRGAQR